MHKRSDSTWLTVAGFMVLFLGAMLVMPPARAAELAVKNLPVLQVAEKTVHVKLSVPAVSTHTFVADQPITVTKGPRDVTIPANTPIDVTSLAGTLRLRTENVFMRSKEFMLTPASGPIRISSWNRIPAWDTTGKTNDNTFLGDLHLYPQTKGMLVVNDIDLESYMKGVAEVPEQDEDAKRKALAIVARSYIGYYINTDDKKFDDSRYNASDDPAIFQKYLGYGFTLRSPKWQQALKDTAGVVMTYKGEVLRAAYSSCTDESGVRKLPQDIGWGDYFNKTKEVYTAVADPLGVDPVRSEKNQCGHGVGLSGLGATNLAKEGDDYVAILDYYYNAFHFARLY